jgi:hypothetical protein
MKTLFKELVALPEPELKLVKYDTAQDYMKTSVCYRGILRKHPYKEDTVMLVYQPFIQPAVCYEFKIPDIIKVAELPNIVTETGENIRMVNLWIRRGSHGLFMQAFEAQPGGEFPHKLV